MFRIDTISSESATNSTDSELIHKFATWFTECLLNWKLRSDKIATYIKYRRKADIDKIGLEDSAYSILLAPWVDYYKDYYHKKEYLKHPKWDWIGVTTLFTFYWDITIETILFAKGLVKDIKNIMVGGVLASIQPKEIEEATGIKPHCGTCLLYTSPSPRD